MAKRFIVKEENIKRLDEKIFCIYGEEVRHIQVLRFNIGDEIHINEYMCNIIEMKKDNITFEIGSLADKKGEPNVNLKLYMAYLKGEKMEFVIKKAVELGVKQIVPFISKNVVVKLDNKDYLKRKIRFEKLIQEACKQCGRTDSVEILDLMSFNEVISDLKNNDINFFAYENSDTNLKNVISNLDVKDIKNISCIIGPEGGFDKIEVENLNVVSNVKNISMGSRILRAETAALTMCSILMYEFD